jgi:hypothetical protein
MPHTPLNAAILADSGANRGLEFWLIDGSYFFFFIIPESRWFFIYMALSAALTWPIMGAGLLGAAAAAAFGFIACFFAAKAPEVETARIAKPIRIFFFMRRSLGIVKTYGSTAISYRREILFPTVQK